jgi:GNAT superfamily N-acetyltransferase
MVAAGIVTVGMHSNIVIRPGSETDGQLLVEFLDEAVAWMVARGETGQWGDKPVADRPNGAEWVHGFASDSGLRIAELDHIPAGALVVGNAPEYAPAIERSELYVKMLITSRRHAGKQLGSALIRAAIEEGRTADREVLRVDCWAGAPTLVAWYERQGFKRTDTYDIDGWKGQIFSMPLR